MKAFVAVIGIIAVIVLAGAGAWYLSSPPPSGPPEAITVGKMAIPAHATLYIAADRGYFAENGLDVTVREYATGPAAADGLLNGEVEIAASGEYVIVQHALDRAPIRVIASIDRYEFFSLAARRDRGIATASDLVGKNIGVGRRSNADFFLGRFLDLHGIPLGSVTLVDVPPSQWVAAIGNGSVDAVVYNHDYGDAVAAALGANAVVMPVQSDQPLYSLLACRDDWAATHPATIKRFLAALDQADRYVATHPVESRAIVQRWLDLDPEYMDTVWRENRFALSLDQSLIAAMEDEARWMIATKMTNATAIPDFQVYIDTSALEQVRPDGVRIIGRGDRT